MKIILPVVAAALTYVIVSLALQSSIELGIATGFSMVAFIAAEGGLND